MVCVRSVQQQLIFPSGSRDTPVVISVTSDNCTLVSARTLHCPQAPLVTIRGIFAPQLYSGPQLSLKGTGFEKQFTNNKVKVKPTADTVYNESNPVCYVTGGKVSGGGCIFLHIHVFPLKVLSPNVEVVPLDIEIYCQADFGSRYGST